MEFGKHIGKGLWGLAGRALPSVYGVGVIVFVIRTLTPGEFGIYTLLQTVFLLSVAMGQSFALQPLVKFGAESDELSGPVSASAILYGAFIIPAAILLLAVGPVFGSFFNSADAGGLLWYVPLMLVVSLPRNIASYLLQARLDLKTLFILDAAYSLGSLLLIALLVPNGILATAEGVMIINTAMLAVSSLYGLRVIIRKHAVRFAVNRVELARSLAYGRYSLGASVSYSLYAQSDNLVISALLGPVHLAVYNAAKMFTRVFEMALQLITTLLVPTVAKLEADKREREKLELAEKSLFLFSAALALVSVALLIGGPFLLELLYDGKYRDSAGVLNILALSGIFIPAISVGSSYCFALGKMKEVFSVNVATSVIGLLLLLLGTSLWGVLGAAGAVVCTYVLMAVVWTAALRTRAGIPVRVAGVLSRSGDIPNAVGRWYQDHRRRAS